MSDTGPVPSYDADLYTDDALAEPYEHYRALRDLGPVVWLEAHGVYAVTRYEDVRAVLSGCGDILLGSGRRSERCLERLGSRHRRS